MCNCGKQRIETFDPYQQISNKVDDLEVNKAREDNHFEYIGKTGLTVTGLVTGRKYRFNFSGDVQPVDYEDSQSMMAVPVLKKLRI